MLEIFTNSAKLLAQLNTVDGGGISHRPDDPERVARQRQLAGHPPHDLGATTHGGTKIVSTMVIPSNRIRIVITKGSRTIGYSFLPGPAFVRLVCNRSPRVSGGFGVCVACVHAASGVAQIALPHQIVHGVARLLSLHVPAVLRDLELKPIEVEIFVAHPVDGRED